MHALVDDFVEMTSYTDTFNFSVNQCRETASLVANSWFTFSNFIPNYFQKVSNKIQSPLIKRRIEDIIYEELGEGNSKKNHALLYKYAIQKLGIIPSYRRLESIEFLESCINDNLSEAYFVGLAFGLEIIAQDNINFLLKHSSTNLEDEKQIKKTAFFRIHLINEIEHIKKCVENYLIVANDEISREEFYIGLDKGLHFWTKFWRESIHE